MRYGAPAAADPRRRAVILSVELIGPPRAVTPRLLLDTGSALTIVHPGWLKRAGYDLAAPRASIPIATASSVDRLPLSIVSGVTALGHTSSTIGVLGHALPGAARLDGLLGMNVFGDRRLTIDFALVQRTRSQQWEPGQRERSLRDAGSSMQERGASPGEGEGEMSRRNVDADALRDMLARHGISDRASETLMRLGFDLRARTERAGIEFAAMVDADRGAQLGDIVRGTVDQTTIRSLLQSMRPQREYAQIHTHPGSRPMSLTDLSLLDAWPRVRAMVVVGEDLTWYALSYLPGIRPGVVVREAFRDEAAAVAAVSEADVAAGRAPALLPDRVVRHIAWLRVARRFPLRYDRLEPPEG